MCFACSYSYFNGTCQRRWSTTCNINTYYVMATFNFTNFVILVNNLLLDLVTKEGLKFFSLFGLTDANAEFGINVIRQTTLLWSTLTTPHPLYAGEIGLPVTAPINSYMILVQSHFCLHHFLEADPGPCILNLLSLLAGGVAVSIVLVCKILALQIFFDQLEHIVAGSTSIEVLVHGI